MNGPSKPRWIVAAALLLAAGLAACGGEPVSTDGALERARGAADALTVELSGILGQELRQGGPPAAIGVCSEVAQEIAASHSTGGLTVRRVSLRARNSADVPDNFERRRLEAWEESVRAGETPSDHVEVSEGEGGRELRYLRPLFISGVCLQCHGDPVTFAPEVRQILEEQYPEDPAVGYEDGDLRGAVSVRVAL